MRSPKTFSRKRSNRVTGVNDEWSDGVSSDSSHPASSATDSAVTDEPFTDPKLIEKTYPSARNALVFLTSLGATIATVYMVGSVVFASSTRTVLPRTTLPLTIVTMGEPTWVIPTIKGKNCDFPLKNFL